MNFSIISYIFFSWKFSNNLSDVVIAHCDEWCTLYIFAQFSRMMCVTKHRDIRVGNVKIALAHTHTRACLNPHTVRRRRFGHFWYFQPEICTHFLNNRKNGHIFRTDPIREMMNWMCNASGEIFLLIVNCLDFNRMFVRYICNRKCQLDDSTKLHTWNNTNCGVSFLRCFDFVTALRTVLILLYNLRCHLLN